MTHPAMQSAEDMQRKLMERAADDMDFRAWLMSDPKSAIRDELDVDVPEDVVIHVHESDMNTVHLSLPPGQLDEEQLEAIAAGRCCC
ncbi:MAG: NHLP leader peptide family RiPP precursor [Thiotrichales bacterium]|nr:NHLP leader peptide family RiPP precursor [Thiotrichales bacterium]MCY4285944.1 NHLP leader peptide family RiPP precursor [Thiotrichales bacterium]MCY4350932.1 NHLP leader peptide family RiPP precursor [Thiotrichales bacterium]